MKGKIVGIGQCRELSAKLIKRRFRQFGRNNLSGAGFSRSHYFPFGVDNHRVARIADSGDILSHPVYAGHISLVFDGTGLQQGLPHIASVSRPIGAVDEQIIIAPVAAEYRKPQVVTNQRKDRITSYNVCYTKLLRNNRKRDKIPSVALIESQKELIIQYWEVRNQFQHERFKKEIGITLLGETNFDFWQTTAITQLKSTCNYLISQRGFEQWDGRS